MANTAKRIADWYTVFIPYCTGDTAAVGASHAEPGRIVIAIRQRRYTGRMTASPRIDVSPPRSRVEYGLEVVSVLAVLVSLGMVGGFWDSLPERVPRHFGAAGNPDAYGPKGNVLTPALLAVGLYLLFTVVQRIPPRFYNYPFRITADNVVAQYRLARTCLATVKAGLSVFLACGTWMTVQVALGHRQGLGAWFLPGSLMVAVLPLVWYGCAAYRHR